MKPHEHRADTGEEEVDRMATSRKTSARSGKSRPATRPSRPARSAGATGGKSAPKAARSKPAVKRTPAKPVKAAARPAKPPSPGKPVAKTANLKPNAKAAAKDKVLRPVVATLKRSQAEVRPLGVLPPESMMRSSRPAPPPVMRPRPATAKPKTTTAPG